MRDDENVRVDRDWCPLGSRVTITDEQKKRKKKTGSYYRRDEQTSEYKVSKGEFV